MNQHSRLTGACGLDCRQCDIFRAPSNPELAHELVEWYRKHRGREVRPKDIHCSGCKGDRAKHWLPSCWILKCCVDEKGLEFCYQCYDFPCPKLNEWAKGAKEYEAALRRLKKMKRGEEDSP